MAVPVQVGYGKPGGTFRPGLASYTPWKREALRELPPLESAEKPGLAVTKARNKCPTFSFMTNSSYSAWL